VHPGIVPLFDSGWHGDRLYYVMPCITGTTLREQLGTRGRLPMEQALRLVADVAEALAYAHAMGFVHRDIKPENAFNSNGRALVSDFGIARAIEAGATPHSLTEAGIAIGTVAYMSPEQALGQRELDGRSDLACHRSGRVDDAYTSRRTLLGTNRLFERLDRLSETFEREGWEAARSQDLQAERQELLALAAREDPFRDRHTSRQLSDRIIITSGELGEWTRAMDWVERGYYVRPGRLIRVLTDLPFDRRGLASDRRYARLLRTAGLEFLL
jgi:serine/threonine protein kinase